MEEQDMGSNNPEDTESMLAKAASLEKSIIALIDKGCIIREKYYSDLMSWVKTTGLFEEEDVDIKIDVVREKAVNRNTKKPRTLWNKIDIEIDKICDSVNAAIYFGESMSDKFKPADTWLDKIQSLLDAGQSEISNLKKKHLEEIEEFTKVLERKKHEITLLKEKKLVSNQLKRERLSD